MILIPPESNSDRSWYSDLISFTTGDEIAKIIFFKILYSSMLCESGRGQRFVFKFWAAGNIFSADIVNCSNQPSASVFSAGPLILTTVLFCFVFPVFILCYNRVLKNPIWKFVTSRPLVLRVIYVHHLETNIFMRSKFMCVKQSRRLATVLYTL